MGTNVSAMRIEDFTDKSGVLHVGMKRDEAAKLKNGIFTNWQKEFDRADKNINGVIEAEELSAQIKLETKGTTIAAILTGIASAAELATVALFGKKRSKGNNIVSGILAVAFGIVCGAEISNVFELKRRAKALDEQIRQQNTEKAVA